MCSDGDQDRICSAQNYPLGGLEEASREVKGHMKSVRRRHFRQNIFVVITIAIVVDIIVVIINA